MLVVFEEILEFLLRLGISASFAPFVRRMVMVMSAM
jgi:hypothetical protein